jgi:hypothetical protein
MQCQYLLIVVFIISSSEKQQIARRHPFDMAPSVSGRGKQRRSDGESGVSMRLVE